MQETLRRVRAALPRVLIGLALVLLGAGAVVIAAALDADADVRLVGGDRPINTGARDQGDISAHNSPSVARNPVRRSNMAVADRIDSPRFSCSLHVSFDGGRRWLSRRGPPITGPGPRQIPFPIPPGEEPKCYAPDVSFAADGTLYMSFVTLRGRGNVPHAVWLISSKDGGRTLSQPTRILPEYSYQVRLSADPVNPRRLYLSWLESSDERVSLFRFVEPGQNPIRFARSDDGGRTWTRPAQVNSPRRGRVVAPSHAVGPNGEIYLLYLDLRDDRLDYEGGHEGLGGPPHRGSFHLVLARSRDRGATWAESVVDERIVPTERFLAFLPPFPSLAVDRESGRVYAGFHDGRLGEPDVWVWSLARGARGWEGPTKVNDTPDRDRTSQYLPRLAVGPDGRLDVLYYDRRADRKNVRNEVSFQSSFDHGESFTPRTRLSSRPTDSRVGFGNERQMPDLGNRLGLLSDAERAFAVWSDTRDGNQLTNKQDLWSAEVAVSGAGASKAVKYGLLIVGVLLALAGVVLLASALRPRPRPAPA